MGVLSARFSLLKKIATSLLAVSFFNANSAHAFWVKCGSDQIPVLSQVCSGYTSAYTSQPTNVALAQLVGACNTCLGQMQQAVELCKKQGEAAGFSMLTAVTGAHSNVQAGSVAPATQGLDAAKNVGTVNAVTPTADQNATASCSSCPNCSVPVAEIKKQMHQEKLDSGAAAANAAGVGGGLKDMLMPGLIGAGLGALAGYMMGGDDEGEESSTPAEIPPSLPPPPEAPIASAGSSSTNSSVGNSSSSTGIDIPAVVQLPVIRPGEEGGGGDSEILVASNDALDGDDSGDLGDSTTGGSTTAGGTAGGDTTGGGSTGNGTEVVDAGDSTDGDVIVENDETAIGLVGGAQRTGASFVDFGASGGAQENSGGGNGSNMVLGTPQRNRGLSGSSSSRAVRRSSSSSSSSSAPLRRSASTSNPELGLTGSQASSVAPARTREQIREDLRRRGLIQ